VAARQRTRSSRYLIDLGNTNDAQRAQGDRVLTIRQRYGHGVGHDCIGFRVRDAKQISTAATNLER
jgi:hypothetical protein